MVNKGLVLLLCLLWSIVSVGQNDNSVQQQQMIEQRIEAIVENLDEGVELDYTTLFDELSFRLDNPLDLNKANEQELRQLYMLSDLQILGLFNHLKEFGDLEDIHELQAIKGWDMVTIYFVLPFVRVGTGLEANKQVMRSFFC